MIHLRSIKVVVFDFDDTLCIHRLRPRDNVEQVGYLLDMLENKTNTTWETSVISPEIKEFIKICIDKGIHIGLISSTGYFISMKAKQEWAEKNYECKFENYCVGRAELKITELKALAKQFKCENKCIMIVDDLYDTLESASMEGFTACSPMEIVDYMHNIKNGDD